MTWVPGRQVALLLWAYFAAVAVDPGRVPPDWHPFGSDEVRPAAGPGCDAGVPCAGACFTLRGSFPPLSAPKD